MKAFVKLASGFTLVVLCNFVLRAQTETANISGLVTDPSGAPVPNAEIILQSAERGTKMETITNDSGQYALPAVLPGHYQLTARKPGFKHADLHGIIVNVHDQMKQNFSGVQPLEAVLRQNEIFVSGIAEHGGNLRANRRAVLDDEDAGAPSTNGPFAKRRSRMPSEFMILPLRNSSTAGSGLGMSGGRDRLRSCSPRRATSGQLPWVAAEK